MAEVPPSSTSASLLDQVRRHDEIAWRRLTQIYGPCVYRWCRRAGLQSTDAADVVQVVFQTVAKRIDGFHRDQAGDSFRGWLWTIYRSKLMDHFRRCKAEPPAVGGSAGAMMLEEIVAAGESDSDDEDSARLVRRALEIIQGDFNERTWQAFWRSVALDQRTGDVAGELDLTPAAVCMCRSRVLRRLRETLDGLGIVPDEQ